MKRWAPTHYTSYSTFRPTLMVSRRRDEHPASGHDCFQSLAEQPTQIVLAQYSTLERLCQYPGSRSLKNKAFSVSLLHWRQISRPCWCQLRELAGLLCPPFFSSPTGRGEGGEEWIPHPDDLDPCGEVQISHTFLGSTSRSQLASTNPRYLASCGCEC